MKTATTLALMAVGAEALLKLDVNLPLGINVDLDLLGKRPMEAPCQVCLDTWHPPHDVIIDDCDDTGAGDWHWIHPCSEHEPEEPSYTWGTSIMTATQTSTVLSCPLEVPDCPGQSTMYTDIAVAEQTTICPIPIETLRVPTYEVPDAHVLTTKVSHVPEPSKGMPPVPPAHETPWVPAVPSVPVARPSAPPVHVPVVPPYVSMPPYGNNNNNTTEPVPTPSIAASPPATGAAQNVQHMSVAAIAGVAAFALL